MLIDILILLPLFFVIELIYFRIAKRYQIVDRPNDRSSHKHLTIRGGGILFPIAVLLFFSYTSINNLMIASGLLTVALLSFIDDIRSVSSNLRLLIQGLAVAVMLYSLFGVLDWYYLPICFILVIGVINAYNFMDGINGITVLYSIICISTLFWISEQLQFLQTSIFFLSLLSALLVFAFFNVRSLAKCFAGDVGSVSIAFIICFLVIELSLFTQWLWWILLLSIYGIDVVVTIICRLFRKEQLMKAHRSHFYQYLANEKKLSHIQVSLIYTFSQLILNIIVIYSYLKQLQYLPLITLFVFLTIYIIFRFRLEGRKRLFVTY